MSEKQIKFEVITTYCLKDEDFTKVKRYISAPESETKGRDWGIEVARELYDDEEVFPCFQDLDEEHNAIHSEVYTLDDKGIRNGKAQTAIWGKIEEDFFTFVDSDLMYKDGKLHGAVKQYSVKIVPCLTKKTFFIDGMSVEAKTVAEWRKMQSVVKTGVKSKQGRKR